MCEHGGVHLTVCVVLWGWSEDKSVESVLPSNFISGAGIKARLAGLQGRCLYLQSTLLAPSVTFITDVFLAWLTPQSASISLDKHPTLLPLDPFLSISFWQVLISRAKAYLIVKCMWNLFCYMGKPGITFSFSHMAGPHIIYCLISLSPWIFPTASFLSRSCLRHSVLLPHLFVVSFVTKALWYLIFRFCPSDRLP